jgi:hypothetical protein
MNFVKMKNKKGQMRGIFSILTTSIVFIISWFVIGVMELSSGFISQMLQMMITVSTGVENASFAIKMIVPAFFIFSMLGFILYLKGASSEI